MKKSWPLLAEDMALLFQTIRLARGMERIISVQRERGLEGRPPLVESMACDICVSETQVRHGIDLRRDIWCCSKCLRIFRSIREHYSGKGYSNERCIAILRGVVEKQKRLGRWTEGPD